MAIWLDQSSGSNREEYGKAVVMYQSRYVVAWEFLKEYMN